MTAAGKVNGSKVQAGDRILIKVLDKDAPNESRIEPSATKTGEGVMVATVQGKIVTKRSDRAVSGYTVMTMHGEFYAAGTQTMILAPEDAAGIKRAHVEALAENGEREALAMDAVATQAPTSAMQAAIAAAPMSTARREAIYLRGRQTLTARQARRLAKKDRRLNKVS